jgi:hypothetical protein
MREKVTLNHRKVSYDMKLFRSTEHIEKHWEVKRE